MLIINRIDKNVKINIKSYIHNVDITESLTLNNFWVIKLL